MNKSCQQESVLLRGFSSGEPVGLASYRALGTARRSRKLLNQHFPVGNLWCYQEEADTKMVHHICQLNSNYRVQIHCTDSDVPVIMQVNFKYLKDMIEVVVNLSTSTKKCTSISIKSIKNLEISCVLLWLYATSSLAMITIHHFIEKEKKGLSIY